MIELLVSIDDCRVHRGRRSVLRPRSGTLRRVLGIQGTDGRVYRVQLWSTSGERIGASYEVGMPQAT